MRVINQPGFETLGDCRNKLLELATGDYVRTWDDDDLYLPWAISQGVAHIGREAAAFKPARSWFWEGRNGFRLEDNTFEAAMLVRADVARKYGYKTSGGDEHVPLLEGITQEGGGLLRDFGIWASYCYTWGIGNWHISGSLGSGTVQQRTSDWMQHNSDLTSPQITPVSLDSVWSQLSAFCGRDRQSWYQAAKGEPVSQRIDVPKSRQLTELIDRCIPQQAWHALAVLEFGRLRNDDPEKLAADGGSTLQLATDNRVRKVMSVDPDTGTEETCRRVIPAESIDKVKFVKRIEDCPVCSMSAYFSLLLLDADDCPLQNLSLLRKALPALHPQAIIAVDDYSFGSKHLLIREVLRPTHFETAIGDLLVFTRRPNPGWNQWPIDLPQYTVETSPQTEPEPQPDEPEEETQAQSP